MSQGQMLNGRDYAEFPHPDGFKMPYESPSEWEELYWEDRYNRLTNKKKTPYRVRYDPEGMGRRLYG